MKSVHIPVLLHETIEGLLGDASESSTQHSFVYLDGTLGGAGHMQAFIERYRKIHGKKSDLIVVGLDRDDEAVVRAREKLSDLFSSKGQLILEKEDYRNLDKILGAYAIDAVDAILLDLGISSDELDNSGRGFTFQKDEPLLMTMGDPKDYPFTASTIVNEWAEEDIANVIFGYGEERYAYRIARAIIRYREKKISSPGRPAIATTMELAEIIKGAVPPVYRRGKIHPATRTFQGLRIAVNDELGALRKGLEKGYAALRSGGRFAVISFHSLEDRIVKEFFKNVDGLILTKKPIIATDQESAENPRSRSAKLRIIQKK